MSIVLRNVCYTYMQGTPFERIALDAVSLEIKLGEFVAVAGHTGSGKSTLMQHFSGLLKPMQGTVTVDGVDLHAKGLEAKSARRKVGMVFQYPEQQLFEETIFADIAFGPRNLALAEAEIEARVRKAMEFVDLDFETYKEVSPFQLSGGQMRRVAIAGVVALQPAYLVLDEPSAGLDPRGRDALFAKMRDLHEKTKTTVILVSHNMDDIARLAQRLIVLRRGAVLLDDAACEAFQQAEHLRAAGLDVPQTTALLQMLREKGMPVETDARSPLQAADAILAAVRRRKKC